MKTEYTIDFSNAEEAARTTVTIFRDQLISFRKTTPDPEALEWEIRVYDYIFEDPVNRLPQYQDARMKGGALLTKRAAIAKLGWEIK